MKFAVEATDHPSTFDYVLTCAIALQTEWQFLNETTYRWRIRKDSHHKSLSHDEVFAARKAALKKLLVLMK